MKKILLGTLAVASLATIAAANTQIDFFATQLGGNDWTLISADAEVRIDGAPMGRLAANNIFTGGSPLRVSCVWEYDTADPFDTGMTFEQWVVDMGSEVRLADMRFTLTCPDGSTQVRVRPNGYAYLPFVPFPTLIPNNLFAAYEPCPQGPVCEEIMVLDPTSYDFGTVHTNVPQTTTFTICNNSIGDCPPISGVVTEACDVFSVEPMAYVLAQGECQEFTVTFTGVHGGPTTCDVITTHGTFTCTVDDQVSADDRPVVFALGEAYPNPFNPTTTLSFSVENNEDVTLNVYNTAGQLVRTLVNGMVERGEHKVVFDANHLASGVYVYTLKTANQSAMNKMVLVK